MWVMAEKYNCGLNHQNYRWRRWSVTTPVPER